MKSSRVFAKADQGRQHTNCRPTCIPVWSTTLRVWLYASRPKVWIQHNFEMQQKSEHVSTVLMMSRSVILNERILLKHNYLTKKRVKFLFFVFNEFGDFSEWVRIFKTKIWGYNRETVRSTTWEIVECGTKSCYTNVSKIRNGMKIEKNQAYSIRQEYLFYIKLINKQVKLFSVFFRNLRL